MYIDTHCHLNFEAFKDDLPQVIKRAKDRGVMKIVIPGTDVASSTRAIEIARAYPGCYAAVGIHPHHAKDPNLKIDANLRDQLKQLIIQNRPARNASHGDAGGVVAIGEIGLDYHVYRNSKYENTEITEELKQKQQELFLLQYELAHELNLSTILHCREAHDDLIQTISNNSRIRENLPAGRQAPSRPPGVFHCYGGSKKHLRLLITMGYYIGFDGNITYSPDWKTIVSSAPLSRIVLETDAPYLTPVPFRGKRNEPMQIPLIAQAVAEYTGASLAEATEMTTKNAEALFKIS